MKKRGLHYAVLAFCMVADSASGLARLRRGATGMTHHQPGVEQEGADGHVRQQAGQSVKSAFAQLGAVLTDGGHGGLGVGTEGQIVKAVGNSLKINDDDSYIVRYIKNNTPENAVVFLTGIGKCYPILRSHKVLNNLHQAFVRVPVVMFFPGTYNEQELILFNELKDDNYYRAFRLVK